MAAGKFVAYYRVSTERQGRSGLGLEAQRAAVLAYLNGGDWELVAEFTEIESGKRTDRAELAKALAECRRRKATLVIAKLDRLARNVAFVAGIMEAGVDFVAVDNPHANKLTVHILAAMAEHEREQIAARTRAALAATKARGKKLGFANEARGEQQAEASERGVARNRSIADGHAANVLPIIEQLRRAGLSTLRDIADALNARGVKTARGGAWHASTVQRVLARQVPGEAL